MFFFNLKKWKFNSNLLGRIKGKKKELKKIYLEKLKKKN